MSETSKDRRSIYPLVFSQSDSIDQDTGAINQLDVLVARVAVTESRTNRLQANHRHILAVAKVRRAIGEGKPVLDEVE